MFIIIALLDDLLVKNSIYIFSIVKYVNFNKLIIYENIIESLDTIYVKSKYNLK